MNKEFIPYEQALSLKELGFDEPCFGQYLSSRQSDWKIYELILEMGMNEEFEDNRNIYLLEGACSAPTYSQAFRWFREKYGLDSAVLENRYIIETKEDLPNWYYGFKTYEESELACLLKLIGIVKIKYSSNDAPTWYN